MRPFPPRLLPGIGTRNQLAGETPAHWPKYAVGKHASNGEMLAEPQLLTRLMQGNGSRLCPGQVEVLEATGSSFEDSVHAK